MLRKQRRERCFRDAVLHVSSWPETTPSDRRVGKAFMNANRSKRCSDTDQANDEWHMEILERVERPHQ
ncbi:hypothetical protein TNCV_3062651 [Trichonephila clavipes]|nr:hypothetical protein TNCV_3062651 [Trichonephila clavipes]